jgi:hypothetical protein
MINSATYKVKKNKFASLIIFSLSVFFVHAQETIVDVSPDEVIVSSSSPYSIDFADDGSVEFVFRVQEMSGDTLLGGQPSTYDGASAIVECMNGQPAGETANGVFTLTNFSEGETVSSSNEFGTDPSYSLGINLLIDAGIGIFPYVYGSFLGMNNQFLGIRFSSGSNTHYGWVELSVSPGADTVIIHSYGYDETPEQMIEVGGLGAIFSFDNDAVKIWSQSESFTISVSDKFIGKDFQVISMTGNVVYSGTLRELKTQIGTILFPEGIYNVLIDSSTSSIIRKVYKH